MVTIFLAALAVLGLFTLLWFLYAMLLLPAGRMDRVCIRILSTDAAEDTEHILSALRCLERAGLLEGRIEIVDDGLNETGRATVEQLVRLYPGVGFIT